MIMRLIRRIIASYCSCVIIGDLRFSKYFKALAYYGRISSAKNKWSWLPA